MIEKRTAICLGALALVYLIITLPILLFGVSETIYTHDQDNYYFPAVRAIHEKWPALDVRADSLSATAPGYQYLLATMSLFTGESATALRLLNLCVGFLALAFFLVSIRIYIRASLALLLVLPLATSNFFIKSACWVVTDNAALGLVILTLVLALRPPAHSFRGALAGVAGALATFVRQLNLWLVAPLFVSALYDLLPVSKTGDRAAPEQSIISRASSGFACVLPLGIVVWLYYAWGGLVPSQWREASTAFSFCPIAYLLAVFAMLGSFYATGLDLSRWRAHIASPLVLAAAVAGLGSALASPTSYDYEAGRWGGYFWGLVCLLPAIGDRSIFFIVLAPLGAALLAIFYLEIGRSAGSKFALIWATAVVAWASTFLVNRQVFHRYFEPMSLVLLIIGVALARKGRGAPPRLLKFALILLTLLQVGITIATTSEAFGVQMLRHWRR